MNNNFYNPDYVNYMAARHQAERVVKAKIGFRWHLASYTIINALLIAIYLLTSWEAGDLYYPWFLWPLVGWGVGLFFNFVAVYVFPDTPQSRQRMVDQELERMGMSNVPPMPAYPVAPDRTAITVTPAADSNVPAEPLRR